MSNFRFLTAIVALVALVIAVGTGARYFTPPPRIPGTPAVLLFKAAPSDMPTEWKLLRFDQPSLPTCERRAPELEEFLRKKFTQAVVEMACIPGDAP